MRSIVHVFAAFASVDYTDGMGRTAIYWHGADEHMQRMAVSIVAEQHNFAAQAWLSYFRTESPERRPVLEYWFISMHVTQYFPAEVVIPEGESMELLFTVFDTATYSDNARNDIYCIAENLGEDGVFFRGMTYLYRDGGVYQYNDYIGSITVNVSANWDGPDNTWRRYDVTLTVTDATMQHIGRYHCGVDRGVAPKMLYMVTGTRVYVGQKEEFPLQTRFRIGQDIHGNQQVIGDNQEVITPAGQANLFEVVSSGEVPDTVLLYHEGLGVNVSTPFGQGASSPETLRFTYRIDNVSEDIAGHYMWVIEAGDQRVEREFTVSVQWNESHCLTKCIRHKWSPYSSQHFLEEFFAMVPINKTSLFLDKGHYPNQWWHTY